MHHHEDFRVPESTRAVGSTTVDTPGDHIRVGDAEREVMSGRLSRAVADGRLTLTEYDTRLQLLYQAETRGELAEIVADLPQTDDRPETKRQRKQSIPQWVVIMWMPWVAVNILCFAIWLTTGGGYFWPFWVAVPWGCALLIPTLIGVMTGSDVRSSASRSACRDRVRSHAAQSEWRRPAPPSRSGTRRP